MIAHIAAHMDPVFRAAVYERPLAEALGQAGEIAGGGSLVEQGGEILHVDIEIRLPHITEETLDLIVATLERAEAPRGSWLHLPDGTVIRRFGKADVVALEIDAHGLSEQVYMSYNTDDVVDEIMPAMLTAGTYSGLHMTRTRGILYFHGRDPGTMERAIRAVAERHPLCQNAVVRRLPPAPGPGPD